MATRRIYAPIIFIITITIESQVNGIYQNDQVVNICRSQYYNYNRSLEINASIILVNVELGYLTYVENKNNLRSLEIKDSNFSKIYDNVFDNFANLVQLILTNDNVAEIDYEAFSDLVKLEYLDLSRNRISALNTGAFRFNLNLKILILNGNKFGTLDAILPSLKLLKNLRELDVGNNNFQGDVNQLSELPPDLKVLDVSYTNIRKPNFKNISSLCQLDVGGNRYDTEDLKRLLTTLNRTAIKVLIVGNDPKGEIVNSNQHPVLQEDTFPVLPNLEYLDLTRAQVADIHRNCFRGKMDNLETLIIKQHFLKEIPIDLIGSAKLKNLEITYGQNREEEFNLREDIDYDMPNLENLDLSSNKISLVKANSFAGFPNLKSLQLSDCQIVQLKPYAFNQLPRLKVLNVSNNLMDEIVNHTFANLDDLETLVLDRNNLKVYPHNDPFVKLYNLKSLSFRYNSLCEIWWYLLLDQINLEYLDGRDNKLESWKIRALYNTSKLTTMLLQKNEITKVSQPMLLDLVNVPYVDISDNPFNCCDCDIIQTQNWILNRTKSEELNLFHCLDCSGSPYHLINATLPVSCTVSSSPKQSLVLPLSLTSVAFVLVTLSLTYTAYRLRWFTKYYYYVFCVKIGFRGKPQMGKGDYSYDAYVSYSKKDTDWLNETFLTNLENNKTKLKFYVRERDGEVGRHVIDNIVEGMERSRYFVALLSDNYLKSCWRMWELKLAVCRAVKEYTPNIIVINLDGSSERATNKSVKHAVTTQIYLHWSEETFKQKVVMEKITQKLNQIQQRAYHKGVISQV